MSIKSMFKSPTKRNNLIMCLCLILLIGLILWLTLSPKEKTNQSKSVHSVQFDTKNDELNKKIIIPIGNNQSVALTREEYEKLTNRISQENYKPQKENFYIGKSDYIPSVQTENEYSPMLSLYRPKDSTRIVPESVVPTSPVVNNGTGTNIIPPSSSNSEPFGNVFLDNVMVPKESDVSRENRMKLAQISPFFLNNGELVQ